MGGLVVVKPTVILGNNQSNPHGWKRIEIPALLCVDSATVNAFLLTKGFVFDTACESIMDLLARVVAKSSRSPGGWSSLRFPDKSNQYPEVASLLRQVNETFNPKSVSLLAFEFMNQIKGKSLTVTELCHTFFRGLGYHGLCLLPNYSRRLEVQELIRRLQGLPGVLADFTDWLESRAMSEGFSARVGYQKIRRSFWRRLDDSRQKAVNLSLGFVVKFYDDLKGAYQKVALERYGHILIDENRSGKAVRDVVKRLDLITDHQVIEHVIDWHLAKRHVKLDSLCTDMTNIIEESIKRVVTEYMRQTTTVYETEMNRRAMDSLLMWIIYGSNDNFLLLPLSKVCSSTLISESYSKVLKSIRESVELCERSDHHNQDANSSVSMSEVMPQYQLQLQQLHPLLVFNHLHRQRDGEHLRDIINLNATCGPPKGTRDYYWMYFRLIRDKLKTVVSMYKQWDEQSQTCMPDYNPRTTLNTLWITEQQMIKTLLNLQLASDSLPNDGNLWVRNQALKRAFQNLSNMQECVRWLLAERPEEETPKQEPPFFNSDDLDTGDLEPLFPELGDLQPIEGQQETEEQDVEPPSCLYTDQPSTSETYCGLDSSDAQSSCNPKVKRLRIMNSPDGSLPEYSVVSSHAVYTGKIRLRRTLPDGTLGEEQTTSFSSLVH